jgi:putative chitinase
METLIFQPNSDCIDKRLETLQNNRDTFKHSMAGDSKMNLTNEILMTGCGCSEEVASAWLPSIIEACNRFEINTPQRVAAFLSNLGVESGGLIVLVESLDYDAPTLSRTWPTRYAENPHGVVRVPNAMAYELANQPQRIANNVYANRMGNGNEASGDGWKYRGRGPFRITGRLNITNCGVSIGADLVDHPELLEQPKAGAMSAAWLFYCIGLNEIADEGNIDEVIGRICGAMPCDANKGALRLRQYADALAMLETLEPIQTAETKTVKTRTIKAKPPEEKK